MEALSPMMTVIIKAANQKISDQSVQCNKSWAIKTLKEHLSLVYPGCPDPSDQKLIYIGQLLTDTQIIGDIISSDSEESCVIHLVWVSKEYMEGASSSSSVPYSSLQNNQRDLQREYPVTNLAQYFPTFPTLSQDQVNQQLMYMQQYSQYYQQYLAMVSYYQGNVPRPLVTPANTAPAPVNPQVVAQPQRPQQPQAQAQQPNQRRDDEHNRDWVDWFYTLSRAIALLSIIYFYSSPGRFFLVTVVAAIFYMYHLGYLRPLAVPPPQPQQQQPDVNDNGPENIINAMDGDGGIRAPLQANPPPALQVSTFATVWSFIVTFFTSLVPEYPAPQVNAN